MSDKKDTCKESSGLLIPVINLSSCEGKGPCIEVCPYDVLEMQTINDKQYKSLSFFGKIKTRVHGREKALAVRPEDCHSCGLCVTACPEKAIKLQKPK